MPELGTTLDSLEGGAEVCAIWTEAALVAAKDRRGAIRANDLITAFERVERRPELRHRRA